MASGCIFGSCIYCGELVWEDEDWDISEVGHYHISCKENGFNALSKYTSGQLIEELARRL